MRSASGRWCTDSWRFTCSEHDPLTTLGRHPRPRIRRPEAAGPSRATHPKVVPRPRAQIGGVPLGRLWRGAGLETVQAHGFGSPSCTPTAGGLAQGCGRRMAPRSRTNTTVLNRTRCTDWCRGTHPTSSPTPRPTQTPRYLSRTKYSGLHSRRLHAANGANCSWCRAARGSTSAAPEVGASQQMGSNSPQRNHQVA